MNIATKSRDAGEGAEGTEESMRPSCLLFEGVGGAKVPCFEMRKNPFQTLVWYNGDTVSYINYMIGGEIYFYDCEKYNPC